MHVYMWSYTPKLKRFWALIFQLKAYVAPFLRIDRKV